ncbi:MAG: hypothetical protein KDI19_16655, partial [Pseudomonadales bacterium]|nr:hypothetical protein [Pseudomonadales bacterium]
IRSVRVNDVALHYDDRQGGSIYDVTIPDLETGAIRFDEPTHLLAEVHIDDNAGMTSDVNAEGDITLGKGFGKVAFSGLKLRQTTELPDMSPINVQLTLDGTFDLNKSALDTSLAGTVNNSSLKGKLQADLADIVSANFNLALDKLNVNDYLGDDMAGEPAPASSADVGDGMKSAPPEDTQVLPLDLMRSFKLDGKLTVDSITYDSWQFSDFSAKIVNDTKKLSAILGMKGYDGEMAIDFTGSSEGSGAGLTRMNVNGIDLTKLLGFESVTGKITFDSNTTFTGNMLSDVLKTLDGTTTFAIDNGTLDVTPVKKLAAAVDALRGKQSSVANWPDKMPFDHLGGQHRFIKGVSADQQFNFSMELMEAKGTGGLDYFGNHLAYDIAVKLAENPTGQFQISKDLANIEWPIHCEGSLDDSPADLCRPDKSALEKMITGAAKEKLKEKVQEKVGDKLKDLFKGLR